MESNGNVTVISFSQQDNQGKDQFSAINNNQEISSTKDQKKRRKRKRAKIRKHFALTTTCGGLAQLYINKNKWVRLIWTLVILALVGLLVWEVSLRFQAFLRLDTRQQISKKYVSELPLPAITICNANRYFDLTPEEKQALNTISFLYDNGFPPSNGTAAAIEFFERQGDNFNLTDYLISKSWPFNEGTIQICNVGDADDCTAANFSSSFSTNSGQCWTFDTEVALQKRGIIHGFHILLDIYQFAYTEDPTYGKASAGILFEVHPKHEPPAVLHIGQSVGAGQWGTVAMIKQQFSNMYKPWGNCVPSNEYLEKYPTYTLSACLKECYDKLVINVCGCRDPPVRRFPEIRECSPREVLECAAYSRSLIEAQINTGDCNCTQACSETVYKTSISYSTFPSQIAAREIGGGVITLEEFRENFVGMTFYYDSLSTTTIVESEAISISGLISDVGGQLGFWIGISVVTLFEFAQFFIKLILTMDWETFMKKSDS